MEVECVLFFSILGGAKKQTFGIIQVEWSGVRTSKISNSLAKISSYLKIK